MQEPLEGISFNFAFAVVPSDNERVTVPASIAQSFIEGDLAHKLLHEHWFHAIQRQDLNWKLFLMFSKLSLIRRSLYSNAISTGNSCHSKKATTQSQL